jgi:hypothetical protein
MRAPGFRSTFTLAPNSAAFEAERLSNISSMLSVRVNPNEPAILDSGGGASAQRRQIRGHLHRNCSPSGRNPGLFFAAAETDQVPLLALTRSARTRPSRRQLGHERTGLIDTSAARFEPELCPQPLVRRCKLPVLLKKFPDIQHREFRCILLLFPVFESLFRV